MSDTSHSYSAPMHDAEDLPWVAEQFSTEPAGTARVDDED